MPAPIRSTSLSSVLVPFHRALYDQLVDEVIMNPHAEECSGGEELIDHVMTLPSCIPYNGKFSQVQHSQASMQWFKNVP